MLMPKFRVASMLSLLLAIGACGGGGSPTPVLSGTAPNLSLGAVAQPQNISNPTPAQASRFLGQSSFGSNIASIDEVVASGVSLWIEGQFQKPQSLHRDYLAAIRSTLPAGKGLGQNEVFESFWKQAATGDDQLRQRVAFALSEIFVISMQDNGIGEHPMLAASFLDTLGTNAFGNYRGLLEAVALHPAMGVYLTSMHNEKEAGARTPDENFAREVMQLMSIGLYELNADGTQKMVNGAPVETYTSADIRGMARVFTGWGWAGGDKSNERFYGGNPDPDRESSPMQSYPQYHSTSEKAFLGVVIPAQTTADPAASLKVALDRLFNHPNVGPFIGRQLIQRLVTSNPSPAYVGRVSAAFADNGQGVRGDMKAVIRAILLDTEARSDSNLTAISDGKLREPILRLSAWLRAFNASAPSQKFQIQILDDTVYALGQSPLRSPTVFNFFRPGYVPPNSAIADADLVAPEMQLVGETSIVGYLNTMQAIIGEGAGGDHRDIKGDYTAELALADTPDKLIDRVNLLLLANQMSTTLRGQILAAINSVALSTTDLVAAAAARKNRVSMAIFLTMASTEFLVQK